MGWVIFAMETGGLGISLLLVFFSHKDGAVGRKVQIRDGICGCSFS